MYIRDLRKPLQSSINDLLRRAGRGDAPDGLRDLLVSNHVEVLSALNGSAVSMKDRAAARATLTLHLIAYAKAGRHVAFNALVMMYEPMLRRVAGANRKRWRIDSFELDQIVLSAFYDVVLKFNPEKYTTFVAGRLRDRLRKAMEKLWKAEMAERAEEKAAIEAFAAHCDDGLMWDWDEEYGSEAKKALDADRHDRANAERVACRLHHAAMIRESPDEDKGELTGVLSAFIREIDPEVADVTVATVVKQEETLRQWLDREHPALEPDARERKYQAVKRRRTRAFAELKPRLHAAIRNERPWVRFAPSSSAARS